MDNRYIRRIHVYSLFGKDGFAKLHVSDIDRIPSADVAPAVHGRWAYGENGVVFCPYCKSVIGIGNYDDVVDDNNYCYYCGVKMDLEVTNA